MRFAGPKAVLWCKDHPSIRWIGSTLCWKRLLLFVVFLSLVSPVGMASARDSYQKVLVLHSYHKGYRWTDDISQGIETVFAQSDLPIHVQHEFMDTKKFFDVAYQQKILDLYRYKFARQTFDVIMASDDNAFNFLRDYRAQIFPDIPIVYCGTNYLTEERALSLPNSTGVNEAVNLEGSIELIRSLHPGISELVVIADDTTTGKRIQKNLEGLLPLYHTKIKTRLLHDLSIEELTRILHELPKDTAVLYSVFFRDANGQFFEFDESIEKVVNATSVPVYALWDFSLGFGAVGGLVDSGTAQGEAGAQLALRVLQGEPADSIPFIRESPNVYKFDHRALERFEIDVSLLPANSTIFGQPDEIYAKYRDLIWKSSLAAVLLVCIIALMSVNILRRRRAEAQLVKANEALEERVRIRTKDVMLTNQQLNKEIGEHKQALAKITKLSLAIEQSSSSVIILDEDFKIEYVNPRFTRTTGYTLPEVEGEYLGILKGEIGDTDYAGKRDALGAQKTWRGEFHNRRKDGSLYFEVAAMAPVFNENGQLTHYVSINEDVTEKKKADEALSAALEEAIDLSQKLEATNREIQEKNAELEEAYEQMKATHSQMLQQEKMASIGQLAAGVAHEINNPIGFISGNLRALGKYVGKLGDFVTDVDQLLNGASDVPDEIRDAVKASAKKSKVDYILEDTGDLVEESLEGAERVKEIVQGLKTFSRVDQAEHKAVDLNECLESTINIVWNEIKYKATLEKDYGDLPPVDCYPQQLNQVFMNILVNAAQAIENQGTIRVSTRSEGDQIEIAISDTGCGIPEEQVSRIFEPFFTTKEVGKGTGLGMSIAYDIVQKHSGDIRIDSRVGEGTTFTIVLPVAFADAGSEKESA